MSYCSEPTREVSEFVTFSIEAERFAMKYASMMLDVLYIYETP